jgi:hypothetical protein
MASYCRAFLYMWMAVSASPACRGRGAARLRRGQQQHGGQQQQALAGHLAACGLGLLQSSLL